MVDWNGMNIVQQSRGDIYRGSTASRVDSPRMVADRRPIGSERGHGVKRVHRLGDRDGLLSLSEATNKND